MIRASVLFAVLAVLPASIASAQQPQPRAGLWEITQKLTIEGAPEQPARTMQQCVKPAGGAATASRPPGAENCAMIGESNAGGVYRSTWRCPSGRASLEIRFAPDDYAGTVEIETTDQGRTVRSRIVSNGRRLGDC